MDKEKLENLKAASVCDCEAALLSDLNEVTVDSTLSVPKKTESFFSQIDNPYLFKVGDVIMKVEFGEELDFFDAVANVYVKNYH